MKSTIEMLLFLRNEIDCRIEHGATGRAHLLYIKEEITKIMKNEEKWMDAGVKNA